MVRQNGVTAATMDDVDEVMTPVAPLAPATGASASSAGVTLTPEQITCQSCCEIFNAMDRKLVECRTCPFRACRNCHGRYLLSQVGDSHCMACRKPWHEAFLVASFTKKWIKTWWDHRVKTIQRYQKSFIPVAMRLVPQRRATEAAAAEELKARFAFKKVQAQVRETNQRIYWRNRNQKYNPGSKPSAEELQLERMELKAAKDSLAPLYSKYTEKHEALHDVRRYDLDAMIKHRSSVHRHREFAFAEHLTNPRVGPVFELMDPLEHYPRDGHGHRITIGDNGQVVQDQKHNSVDAVAKPVNVWPCPKTGCRAMLNREFRCLVCDTQVCDKCLVIVTDATRAGHECQRDDVLSVRAILNSSQACPRCRIRINRVAGCDQMWCTQCHTAFDYTTGQLIKGHIHNPHYFQQLSAGEIKEENLAGQGPGGPQGNHPHRAYTVGGGCGGRRGLSNTDLLQLERATPFPFCFIVRAWRHISDVTMTALTTRRVFLDASSHAPIPLACAFVLGRINDEQWTKIILSEQMSERFATETQQIYRTWVDSIREEWEKLTADLASTEESRAWMRYMQSLHIEIDEVPNAPPTSVLLLLRDRFLAMQQLSKVCNAALHEVNRIYGKKPDYVLMTTGDRISTLARSEEILALQAEVDPVRHLSPDQLQKRQETVKRKRDAEARKKKGPPCKRARSSQTPLS